MRLQSALVLLTTPTVAIPAVVFSVCCFTTRNNARMMLVVVFEGIVELQMYLLRSLRITWPFSSRFKDSAILELFVNHLASLRA